MRPSNHAERLFAGLSSLRRTDELRGRTAGYVGYDVVGELTRTFSTFFTKKLMSSPFCSRFASRSTLRRPHVLPACALASRAPNASNSSYATAQPAVQIATGLDGGLGIRTASMVLPLPQQQIEAQDSVLRTSRRPSSVRPTLMLSLSTSSHPRHIAYDMALCIRSPPIMCRHLLG
jgi:hypothetical protein